jgi:predicted nucleotidyltransferase component of viral defense system
MSGGGVESSGGSLDALQKRVLTILAGFDPPFILGGGGALAIYLGHRKTRDLDLFWEDVSLLAERPRAIRQRLAQAGLSVSPLQESPGFVRFRVADANSAINLDLVADPTERLERPTRQTIAGAEVTTESLSDLLANKLCAMLGRSEIRDLVDVEALVTRGVSLDQAIASAPRKDGGFSPLTLAWVLRNFDIVSLAAATDIQDHEAIRLDRFRLDLIERLVSSTQE